MNEMILEMQIQKLQDMKSDLNDFCMLMNNHLEELRGNLYAYKAEGFPKEISDKYEQRHYAPARQTVEQMINRIYTLHYNYIDGVIEDLTRALNR
jgi:hypothetical protein